MLRVWHITLGFMLAGCGSSSVLSPVYQHTFFFSMWDKVGHGKASMYISRSHLPIKLRRFPRLPVPGAHNMVVLNDFELPYPI
jgi:hypothetical protein